MLDWNESEKANGDGEFCIHARSGIFRWGSASAIKKTHHIESGKITEFRLAGVDRLTSYSASHRDWEELLKDVPKPFYQDLYPLRSTTVLKSQGTRQLLCLLPRHPTLD
ncbi:MAG: hypothetical protein CM1200mP9_08160 [Gammaproteobacteria bacterium]|nr:MAG: hypothetical protein CM1200mP9_08160 [Gammaproteobacteria bacterium]